MLLYTVQLMRAHNACGAQQLASDREHVNVPLLATLLKAYGPALLSRVPNSDKQAVSALTDKLKETSLSVDEPIQQQSESQAEPHFSAPIEWQVKFRKLCETYFSTLSKRMVKEHMVSFVDQNQSIFANPGCVYP